MLIGVCPAHPDSGPQGLRGGEIRGNCFAKDLIGTGDTATLEEVQEVRHATKLPILIGSGVTKDNVGALMDVADGVIIGSALKQDGVWWRPVDRKRADAFMRAFG